MFVVVRRIAFGPFRSASEAVEWADKQWPGEQHEIVALQDPLTLAAR